MKANNIYGIILAGGKGERLWPLSRKTKPKQMLDIEPGVSLVQATLNRISSLVPKENRFILTTQEQQPLIQTIIKHDEAHIVAEPLSRNTAPAILFMCLNIIERDPDAVIFFLPADHFIKEENIFIDALMQSIVYAQNQEEIILLGVKPSFAATGYGYIEMEVKHNSFNKVIRFHEKPHQVTAQLYHTLPSMLWNIGIFCARVRIFIEHYKKYTPELYQLMLNYMQTKAHDDYEKLPDISFDYAILEKSSEILVKPLDITWSDIGNLQIFLTLKNNYQIAKNVITLDAHNNLVHADEEKLIVLLGVSDLCVVQTTDIVLIAKQSEVEKIKQVVTVVKTANEHMV